MLIKTQYKVKKDDTVSAIAKNYSVTVQEIISVNPNIFTPDRPQDGSLIYPDEILNIPSGVVDELKQAQIIKADAEDELTILIDNAKCPLPHEFEFVDIFDSCSDNFNITYPFDPKLKNPAYKINVDDFVTKGLPGIKLYIGNDPVLTGSIEVPSNAVTPSAVTQALAGRSATFLLEKSDILPSIEREYLNLKLKDLADIVAGAYGISVEIQSGLDISEPFPKVTIEDNEKPFFFLARLCQERNCILGKTGQGKLLIHKAVNSEPVANFKIDNNFLDFIGAQSLEFSFDTRELYGQYQGKTSTPDNQDLTATVKSKFLLQQSIQIKNYSDAEENTLKSMTEWEEQKAIRGMYKNAIPYPDWLNPNTGKRWKTGQLVTIESTEAGLAIKTLLIRSIRFLQSADDRKTAVLNLMPVGGYL